jgi:hypothetical protein
MLERDDEDLGRKEILRARLRHSLPARFLLRYHLTVIVLAAVAAGWVLDVGLLRAGLRLMIVRYPLAVLASYGVFVLGIGVWLRYSGIAAYVNRRRAGDLIGDHVPAVPRVPAVEATRSDWVEAPLNLPDPEGCLWFAILGLAFLALGGYTIATAPTFFADIVLEVLLAAGLVRGVRRLRESGWVSSVIAGTWGSPALAMALAFVAGLLALGMHPHPATLGELWWRLHPH